MVNQIAPIQLPLDFVINSRVDHSSLSGPQNHPQIWVGRDLFKVFSDCRKDAHWVKYSYAECLFPFRFSFKIPKLFHIQRTNPLLKCLWDHRDATGLLHCSWANPDKFLATLRAGTPVYN